MTFLPHTGLQIASRDMSEFQFSVLSLELSIFSPRFSVCGMGAKPYGLQQGVRWSEVVALSLERRSRGKKSIEFAWLSKNESN